MKNMKLVTLRKARGLSQSDLAYLVKVTERQIRAWENSEAVPHPRHLRALAKRLGVSIDELGFPDD